MTDIKVVHNEFVPAAVQSLESGSDWLTNLRTRALHHFQSSEWPAKSIEEYRRTDLSEFPFDRFKRVPVTYSIRESNSLSEDTGSPGDSLPVQPHKQDITITPLEVSGLLSQTAHTALEKSFESANNKIQYWHFTHLDSGCIIHMPVKSVHNKTVIIEYCFDKEFAFYNPHTVIHAESGSELDIVIMYKSVHGAPICVNAGVSLYADSHSRVRISEVQVLGNNSTFFSHGSAFCYEGSTLKRNDISLGSDLVKTRFTVTTRGLHADIDLKGILISSEKQHKDIRIVQRHESGQSKSRSLYRNLVRDQGRTVFQGMISVDRIASGTDAYLSNDNIILNDGARADSIPALHIDTNDVKCSHGSTTGKLDKNKIFYLMSRGFSESDARELLIRGFFEKVLADLPAETTEWISNQIENKLHTERDGNGV